MKVYCNIDTDARKFEGRTQLATKVTAFLKEKGFEFTQNPKEADLFHFHSSGVFESYRAYQLKKKYGKPCIYSLYSNVVASAIMHPINFWIQKKYFQKTATKFLPSYTAAIPLWMRSFFLNKLDVVVVPSKFLQQKLGKNARIIPFGVDIAKFTILEKKNEAENALTQDKGEQEEQEEVAGRKTKKIKVAYFGHAGVFKGLNDFVNASFHFDKDIETHIFMTQRFDKVDKYIARNSKIIIHGFVENITKAYNDMDIVLLPYRTEIGTVANPLVLIEAMACGKAIVTTDFDFVKEVVGNSATISPKFSPKKLAKAVNTLAKDSGLREEMGKKARKIVEEKYSREKMLQGYLNLYQEFAKEKLKVE